MSKLKGPIPLAALAAAVIYAGVLFSESDSTQSAGKSSISKARRSIGATARTGKTPTFPRYRTAGRNVFKPFVTGALPANALEAAGSGTGWILTGISAINGVETAVVENSATQESAFLRSGSAWNGFKVVRIEPTAVVFRDQNGRVTRLTFPEPSVSSRPDPRTVAAPAPARRADGSAAPAPSSGNLLLGASRPVLESEAR